MEVPLPEPTDGQVLIRVTCAGVNFTDVQAGRTGMLSALDSGGSPTFVADGDLPFVPGAEVAGVRTDTGERVVALCGVGGYAEAVVAAPDRVFSIPDGIEDGVALALLIQGLTAWHLYRTAARIEPGDSVVVHAAAGGVGSLAVQLGIAFGARRLIATASTDAKRRLALDLGAHVAIDGSADGLTARIAAANEGEPVDVVFEMTGGSVFDESFAALAPFGRLVTYGTASGQANAVETRRLIVGSRSIIGFWLMDVFRTPGLVAPALADLFERTLSGQLRPIAAAVYPLAEAARAQADVAARRTTGKVLLDVTT